MTDTDAVARYAETRDSEAFAHLVGQYQAMVLATCRRRVASPADVDDAVQETFLRLAKAANTVRTNVAAWLHRCATNVAIDTNRRAQTRKKHETAAAAGRSVETKDVKQELLALREHLDAALLKLDEAARELILQRYFAGRSQTDIAREAGVSSAAISQRLDRAVDALRVYLNTSAAPALAIASTAGMGVLLSSESATGAVPAALTAKLNAIGLTGAPATAAGLTAAAGVSAGAIAAWAVAAVVLIGLTVGAIVFWPKPSPRAAQPQTPPPAAAPAKAAAPEPPPAAVTVRPSANAPAAPDWNAPAAPSTAALSGRVTDAEGKPIAGATVTLEGPARLQRTRTDANGAYAFATLREDGEYRIGVDAEGFMSIESYPRYRNADAMSLILSKTGTAQRNFVLQRGVPVTVRVVDAAGETLENVQVSAIRIGGAVLARAPRFDPQTGMATLTMSPTKEPVAIIAQAKGRPAVYKMINPGKPDEPPDVTLTLDVGISVRGTVFGSDKKPAVGWGLWAKPVDWPDQMSMGTESKIDAAGNFAIADVLPGKHQVWLRAGNTSTPLGIFDFEEDQPISIKLDQPSAASLNSLKVHVTWEGNVDRKTAVVVLASTLDGSRGVYDTRVLPKPDRNREQDFTFPDLPAGNYRLDFDNMQIEPASIARVTVPGPVATVRLKWVGKSSISGQVTDATTGQPVVNFARRLRKLRSIGDGMNYVPDQNWVQVSQADGRYTADVPGPGEYQVQISAGNYAWTWSAPARVEKPGDQATADVKLTAGGQLSGVVLDATGKPLAGAKVVPWSKAASASVEWGPENQVKRFAGDAGAVTTDASGRYTLKHLPAGRETIKIIHPNFAPHLLSNIAVTDGQTATAPDAAMSTGGTVEGTVYTVDGKPAPGVVLQFQDASGYNGDEEAGRVAQTTTDDNGRYRVDHLATQTLWVNLAERWNHPGVNRRAVRPMEGQTATLDFGGTVPVTGRYLRNGQPMPNAKLGFSTGERYFGMTMADVVTDANGRFVIHGLPAGRHILFADIANDRLPLRETTMADQPIDLGDVNDDRGAVTIRLQTQTPGDASKIDALGFALDPAVYGDMPMLAQFKPKKDDLAVWQSDDVPAGRFKLVLYGKAVGVEGTIDRKSGDGALTLTANLISRADRPSVFQPDPAGRVLVAVNLWTKDGLLVTDADVTVTAPAERQPWVGHEITRLLALPGGLKLWINRERRTIERTITVPKPADPYNGSVVDVVLP